VLDAQEGSLLKHLQVPKRSDVVNKQSKVRISCYSIAPSDRKTVFVIDGEVKTKEDLSELNPNEIESITVLNDSARAIYTCRPMGNVVIMTLKKLKNTRFRIIDETDSASISNAAVRLSIDGKTTVLLSGEKGLVPISGLMKKQAFKIAANRAGYLSNTSQLHFDSSGQILTIALKRNISPLEIHILSNSLSGSLRCLAAGVRVERKLHTNETERQTEEAFSLIFPNPAPQNSRISIVPKQTIAGHYRVLALTGQVIHSGVLNHSPSQPVILPTSNWTAGTYIVQLQDAVSSKSYTDKFIIQ